MELTENQLDQQYLQDQITTEVNKNFKIKVTGRNYVGKRLNTVVGVSGLKEIVKDNGLVRRICLAALESPDDVYVRKLRRGLEIKFYSH